MSSSKGSKSSASGLIGLWNSRLVMAPVLGVSSLPPTHKEESSCNEGGSSSSLKVESGKKPTRPSFTKFRQLDRQAASVMTDNSPKKPSEEKKMFVSRSASSAKEVILSWVKETLKDYESLSINNFSSSWSDGLVFCALIHNFYPEAFDFASLKSENRRHNFEKAFSAAEEYAGIYPLLDVEDMVKMKNPDWKCVFTYVQSFYRRFRNGREPPAPNKSLILNKSSNNNSSSVSPDAPRHR